MRLSLLPSPYVGLHSHCSGPNQAWARFLYIRAWVLCRTAFERGTGQWSKKLDCGGQTFLGQLRIASFERALSVSIESISLLPLQVEEAVCIIGEEIQTQNFYIYNTNEVMIQTKKYLLFHVWINKLFRKIRSPQRCLKLERWQGPPHINKVEQYETVDEDQFVYSIYPVMKTKDFV